MTGLPLSILCQVVTVVRGGGMTQNDDGDLVPAAPTRTHYTGVSLQPLQGTSSVEAMQIASDQVVTRWRLFMGPGVDLDAADRVQQSRDRISPVESDEDAHLDLQVDGDPDEWLVTGTSLDHCEAYLKRWRG